MRMVRVYPVLPSAGRGFPIPPRDHLRPDRGTACPDFGPLRAVGPGSGPPRDAHSLGGSHQWVGHAQRPRLAGDARLPEGFPRGAIRAVASRIGRSLPTSSTGRRRRVGGGAGEGARGDGGLRPRHLASSPPRLRCDDRGGRGVAPFRRRHEAIAKAGARRRPLPRPGGGLSLQGAEGARCMARRHRPGGGHHPLRCRDPGSQSGRPLRGIMD